MRRGEHRVCEDFDKSINRKFNRRAVKKEKDRAMVELGREAHYKYVVNEHFLWQAEAKRLFSYYQ